MIYSITPQQANELMTLGEVDVIDVRDPSEWPSGHVPGARLLPLEQLRANPASAFPRDGVLLICAAGMRSQTAARIAASQGLKKIYSLSQGTRGWVRAGFALVDDLSVAV